MKQSQKQSKAVFSLLCLSDQLENRLFSKKKGYWKH